MVAGAGRGLGAVQGSRSGDSQSRLSEPERGAGQKTDPRVPGCRQEYRPQRGAGFGLVGRAKTLGQNDRHLHQRPWLQSGRAWRLVQGQRHSHLDEEPASAMEKHPACPAAESVGHFASCADRCALARCHQAEHKGDAHGIESRLVPHAVGNGRRRPAHGRHHPRARYHTAAARRISRVG